MADYIDWFNETNGIHHIKYNIASDKINTFSELVSKLDKDVEYEVRVFQFKNHIALDALAHQDTYHVVTPYCFIINKQMTVQYDVQKDVYIYTIKVIVEGAVKTIMTTKPASGYFDEIESMNYISRAFADFINKEMGLNYSVAHKMITELFNIADIKATSYNNPVWHPFPQYISGYPNDPIPYSSKLFPAATPSDITISKKASKLPGMNTRVKCPCELPDCKASTTTDGCMDLFSLVQYLNDTAKWSREKIADWLDELHDDGQVNIEFQPWEEEKTLQ